MAVVIVVFVLMLILMVLLVLPVKLNASINFSVWPLIKL